MFQVIASVLHTSYLQSVFIPSPTLTEKNLPDQQDKVFLVTGGYSGIGKELCNILYGANGTVYVAGRSSEKGAAALEDIKSNHPESKGKISFLYLDLTDFQSIKASAEEFLSKETKLNVLWNNAAVMYSPPSQTKDGYDIQYATNILGPYLFTKLLWPLLKETAKNEEKGSVRVAWGGSLGTEFGSPYGGVSFIDSEGGEQPQVTDRFTNYSVTKLSNYFLGTEFARRFASDGVFSLSFNPGNLRTQLQRHVDTSRISAWMLDMALHPPIFGAYTELYAGLSPELDIDKEAGIFIWPWGRKGRILRKDIRDQVAPGESEDKKSNAERLFEWCERETKKWQ